MKNAPSLALLLTTLLSASVSGQIQTRIVVHETLTARLGSVTRTLAIGTDLTGGGGVAVRGSCLSPNDTWAQAIVVWSGAEIAFEPSVGTSNSCFGDGEASGAVLVRFTSPTPVLATIVAAVGSATGSAFGRVEVVGGQSIQSPFLSLGRELEEVVLIDSAGVDVIIAGSATFPFSGGGAFGGGSVRIATAGTRLTAAGTACGPSLRAHYTTEAGLFAETRTLVLEAGNSAVTPFAFFVFGTQAAQVSIPPLGCVLRTNIVVPVPVPVSPGGEASLSLGIPATLGRLDLFSQYLVADQVQRWTTSELVRLTLP